MFYGHSCRRGLIVPNPDPQFEIEASIGRENEDRPQTGLVSVWHGRRFKPNTARAYHRAA
jgi:hypothetical protein